MLLAAYEEGRLDRVYMAYNDFVNSMTQRPRIERLLPFVSAEEEALEAHWDYLYEPGAPEVLDRVFVRYTSSPSCTRRSWRTGRASRRPGWWR